MDAASVVELSPTCTIELWKWTEFTSQLSLEYVEHSPDGWYSDTHTSVEITPQKAREIIEILQQFLSAAPSEGEERER